MNYLSNLPPAVLARAANVRLAAFDVDGTLTDGCLWYDESGHETKVFHVHDGFGLKRLQAHGVLVAIVSARISHTVALRAEELNIAHVYQGQSDKCECLRQMLEALELSPDQAAFVGDDLSDLPALGLAGLAVAVANAHPWVAQRVHWQTHLGGGKGAVREVCDLILHAQGKNMAEEAYWR